MVGNMQTLFSDSQIEVGQEKNTQTSSTAHQSVASQLVSVTSSKLSGELIGRLQVSVTA